MLIRNKLILGFSFLMAFLLLSSFVSWRSLRVIEREVHQANFVSSALRNIHQGNLIIGDYVAAHKEENAKSLRSFLYAAREDIASARGHMESAAQSARADGMLQDITKMESAFADLQKSVDDMQKRVAIAIAASGKAFDSVNVVAAKNLRNLQEQASPSRVEAIDLTEKVKETFLLGRNQFTTFRLNFGEPAREACLQFLGASLGFLDELLRRPDLEEQRGDLQRTVAAVEEYRSSFVGFVEGHKKLAASKADIEKIVAKGVGDSQVMLDAANKEFEDTEQVNVMMILGIAGVALATSIAVAFWIITSITGPLHRAVFFGQQVASGNFAASWEENSTNELGQLSASLSQAFAAVTDKFFHYEGILHSLPFMLGTMDMQKRFTFANKKLQDFLSKSEAELLGQRCNVWGASICDTENCAIENCKRGKHEVLFTQPGLGHFKALCHALHDKSGKATGYIDMVFDINEEVRLKKEAEDALTQARTETAHALEDVVRHVSSASGQLADQVEQTNVGAVEAARCLTQVAAAMEQMSATVLEVARSASEVAGVSNDAKIKAESGSALVASVVTCIADVEGQSLQLKDDMMQLGQQAEAIGTILDVISDIADQTNLLALNAAIEAARAGEAGRGFAVVADEVRKLAEKTMQATVEVGTAIKGVQQSAEKNMRNVDASSQGIVTATAMVTEAGESLKAIVNLVESTAAQIHTIATAAEEQSSTSEEISGSLGMVNEKAGASVSLMTASRAIVVDLTEQARTLTQLLENMRQG